MVDRLSPGFAGRQRIGKRCQRRLVSRKSEGSGVGFRVHYVTAYGAILGFWDLEGVYVLRLWGSVFRAYGFRACAVTFQVNPRPESPAYRL